MRKNSDYSQIMTRGVWNDHLSGKVVDEFAFSGGDSYDTSFFVLMFTDKTYIAIGIEHDDEDGEPYVTDFVVPDPNCVNFGTLDYWVDVNGSLHFDKWVDVLRNLGLWEVTEDEVAELVRKREEQAREREYAEYLRLKKKFECEPPNKNILTL